MSGSLGAHSSVIVSNDKSRALAWTAGKWPNSPRIPDFEPCTTIHLERHCTIQAVVVYNEYRSGSIDMHICAVPGRRWLTKPFLFACFDYPFNQLGCRRVTARIGANNPEARQFLESLGFTHEGTCREAWEPGLDLLIFGLLKAECRFLEPRYNGKIRADAA